MFKSLCLAAVSLITTSCFNSGYRSDNSEVKETLPFCQVQNALNNGLIQGVYNWKDEFDFDTINGTLAWGVEYTYSIESINPPSYNFLVPCWFYGSDSSGSSYSYGYLQQIVIERVGTSCYFTFNTYNSNQGAYEFHSVFSSGTSVNLNQEMILNFRTGLNFGTELNNIFNLFFTKSDNSYVSTYTGYYNFRTGISSFNNPIGVFGPLTFNDQIYLGFTNYYGAGYVHELRFDNWDIQLQQYGFQTYSLPFDDKQVVSRNMLLNGVKIPNSVKTYMSNIGIFSFVRDDTEPSDFRDLLLTIADVPVYFISQFLNFELFGFNLFVACASLVTLLVVIFVVRKLF